MEVLGDCGRHGGGRNPVCQVVARMGERDGRGFFLLRFCRRMAVERVVQPLQEEVRMDWEKIGQFLLALVGGVGGYKMFELLKNWRTDSRKEEASAEDSENESIRKQMDWLADHHQKKLNQVEELQEEKFNLMERIVELEGELRKALAHQCLVPDDECLRRQPADVKCRLRELLKGEYLKDHPDAIIDEEDMKKKGGENGTVATKDSEEK